MSHPPRSLRGSNNTNGPKVPSEPLPGYMLETPSIRRYSFASRQAVTMRSGADNQQGSLRDPSETARRASRFASRKRQSGLRGDMERSAEMTDSPSMRSVQVRHEGTWLVTARAKFLVG
jgi:hypothetical protein